MMMMRKNPIVLATCVLIFSSLTVLAQQSSFGPNECCFHFHSKPLRGVNVISVKWTDNLCPTQGVVVLTRKGRKLCVDPSQKWVKEIMETKENIEAVTASK